MIPCPFAEGADPEILPLWQREIGGRVRNGQCGCFRSLGTCSQQCPFPLDCMDLLDNKYPIETLHVLIARIARAK